MTTSKTYTELRAHIIDSINEQRMPIEQVFSLLEMVRIDIYLAAVRERFKIVEVAPDDLDNR